jgi:hypothetical protein
MTRASSTPLFVTTAGASTYAAPDSEQRVSTEFPMPTRLEVRVRLTESDATVGPMISLRAALVLSSFEARVSFRSSPGTRHGDEHTTGRVTLVPPGERIVRAPHWTRGIPGQNRISLAVLDRDARLLAPELDAGECVGGTTTLELPFLMSVSAVLWMAARAWSDQHGPLIRFSGEIVSLRGVTLRIGFHRSRKPLEGTGVGITEFPLVRPGMTFYSHEKILEAGSPGNPWVSVQFVAEGGRDIDREQLVGRCVRAS